MKYLCFVCMEERTYDMMSQPDQDALLEEHLTYDETLRQSGHLLASEALQPTQTSTLVRVRGGKVVVTDGPFAETREQIGGFFLIEARDLNAAIRLASQVPSARIGSVEIRPVRHLRPPCTGSKRIDP